MSQLKLCMDYFDGDLIVSSLIKERNKKLIRTHQHQDEEKQRIYYLNDNLKIHHNPTQTVAGGLKPPCS